MERNDTMNTKHKLELNFKSAVGFFYFFSSTNVEPKKVCPIAYNYLLSEPFTKKSRQRQHKNECNTNKNNKKVAHI